MAEGTETTYDQVLVANMEGFIRASSDEENEDAIQELLKWFNTSLGGVLKRLSGKDSTVRSLIQGLRARYLRQEGRRATIEARNTD